MNDNVDVSIIFVNYNTVDLTLDAIKSVYEKTNGLNFEIIVVDNYSSDNSIKLINKEFPTVKLICNNKNLGFGKANNIGYTIAKGKYIFFLNTDTNLINNSVKILFDYMENEENFDVGICGGMLYKRNHKPNIYAGYFPSFELFIKGSFWRYLYLKNNLIIPNRKPIPDEPNFPIEVDYVSGADFFIKKSLLKIVGGFDSRFFMYGEDAELAFRVKQRTNKKCMIVPSAKIVHYSQGSSNIKSTSIKFRVQIIKSNGIFYRITKGRISEFVYLLTSYKRLYINFK